MLCELPRIERPLGLEPFELPDSSAVGTRIRDLTPPLWREFRRLSAALHESGEIQATGIDRVAASQHYAKRTEYTFKPVKTAAPIGYKFGSIPYIHRDVI